MVDLQQPLRGRFGQPRRVAVADMNESFLQKFFGFGERDVEGLVLSGTLFLLPKVVTEIAWSTTKNKPSTYNIRQTGTQRNEQNNPDVVNLVAKNVKKHTCQFPLAHPGRRTFYYRRGVTV